MRNPQIVIQELKLAVEQERHFTVRVLELLREIESDAHHLRMGYPSLHEFAVQKLGYSIGAAHRRIQAMRLMKQHPEMKPKLQDGELSLCVAAKTQSFFRNENQKRRNQKQPQLTPDTQREILSSMLCASTRECERKLASLSPESALPKEKLKPLTAEKILVQFVADEALIQKLEKLKGLLAHQNYDGKLEKLIELLADMALKKLDPQETSSRFKNSSAGNIHVKNSGAETSTPVPMLKSPIPKQVTNPELQLQPEPEPQPQSQPKPQPKLHPSTPRQTRYIPAPIRRAVWLRDRGACTYQSPDTGHRCQSRHGLQLDHIQPYCQNGPNTVDNLRLRCGQHNRLTAAQLGLSL